MEDAATKETSSITPPGLVELGTRAPGTRIPLLGSSSLGRTPTTHLKVSAEEAATAMPAERCCNYYSSRGCGCCNAMPAEDAARMLLLQLLCPQRMRASALPTLPAVELRV